MSFQLVCPNEISTLPQMVNAAAQIAHGLAVKSNTPDISDPGLPAATKQGVELTATQSGVEQNRPSDVQQQNFSLKEEVKVKMKTCVKCKQVKSTLEFHKNSRSSDGLHSYCKDCNRAQALAHIKAEKARKALARAARKLAAEKS
ncbi:MAG TPA: hypothetical protein PLF25_03475 [Accumulibacter sp.]|nr:hypothetical protein [Accumulibacter sp.]